MASGWVRLLNYRALGAFLALLLAPLALACASPSPPLTSPPPLHLAADLAMHPTTGHLQQLEDPQGTLDASGADESTGWAPLPGDINARYTDSTLWLRLRLVAPAANQWIVLLRNPLLDSVRIYVRQDDGPHPGAWRLLGSSGEDEPRSRWPVDFRSAAFPFEASGASAYTVLVRLASRNAINSPLEIWQRLAFDNHTRREGLLLGLFSGFYLMLMGLHTLFWRTTRAPAGALFLAYIGLVVAAQLLTMGVVQQFAGLTGPWSDRLLGLTLSFSFPVVTQIGLHQLRLASYFRRLARALRWLAGGTALVCSALVLAGDFSQGVKLLQWLTTPTLLLLCGLAVWLWRRGAKHARFFLIVFAPFYASVLVAFGRNAGLLPANAATEIISPLGSMAHMLLLSLWLVGHYTRQHRRREREQLRLEAELSQRQRRESDLLQALELERRVHQEQRDFVAMVSHELRTPLAVISTSAQQLARHLDAPPEKTLARSHNIRAAAQRLLGLVDDYLADDRMKAPQAAPHLVPCDLHALIDTLCQDFAPGRMHRAYGQGTQHLCTDAALLGIALRNLLANAHRHAPADEAVQISTRQSGAHVQIDVANPSPPLPPDEHPYLFDRYWRGSNARHQPGAGLGLYLVRRIARKLGGDATLVSAGGDEPVCLRIELPGPKNS